MVLSTKQKKLDVADGDFVRWCEEAEEVRRSALWIEEEDALPEIDDDFDSETSGGDGDAESARSEDGDPTQKSTHAPAYFYNKCGKVFDDCVGEL